MTEQLNREGQQFGNYRLERLLGRGSFAEVYVGLHLRLRRPAAIKILHTVLSKQEIDDFQREAQIIAALDHPNIVRVLDFDVQQGMPFLVMDYLPNGTLRQRHKRGERVDLPSVVSYVQQIAAALQYAHDQHLIHRDIKPDNMLIGRHGEIVLSDFGMVAIAHGSASMEYQALVGTAAYIAPEQIQMQAREASDQYALGIVTYEWLSGKRPFEGTQNEIFAKHLMTPPAPFQPQILDLPIDVEQVVLTTLAKDPHQRFTNVQAFATALEQASRMAKESTPSKSSPQLPSKLLTTIVPSDQASATFLLPTEAEPTIVHLGQSPTATQSVQTPSLTIAHGRKYTRRTILIGLGVVGLGAVSAGVTWKIRSLTPVRPYTYHGHTNSVYTVAWSPNGQRLASAGADNTVQVWNAADGSYVYTYSGYDATIRSVAWSPDGQRLVSGSEDKDQTEMVWNVTNGSNAYIYRGYTDGVNGVAWSPNGQRIASANRSGTVAVWNVVDGSDVYIYRGHTSGVNAVAWSPDGQRIASGGRDATVQIMHATDASDVTLYHGHAGDVYAVAWSPDGQHIASGSYDRTVQVWNAVNKSHVFTYHGHTHMVYTVAWSPDGQHIASGSDDSTVQVWNATNGNHVFTYHGHTDWVTAVAWSPDGQRIASSSLDSTVQVWEIQ